MDWTTALAFWTLGMCFGFGLYGAIAHRRADRAAIERRPANWAG